jgi:hypothetical protein
MTDSVKIERPPHDPIASTLSAADDRIVMSEWLPPIVVVDEADDLLAGLDEDDVFDRQASKVFMTRLIDRAPAPTIWITNDVHRLGPAIIRRMNLALRFFKPALSVRKSMVARIARNADFRLDESAVLELARTPAPPALIENAILSGLWGRTCLHLIRAGRYGKGEPPRIFRRSNIPADFYARMRYRALIRGYRFPFARLSVQMKMQPHVANDVSYQRTILIDAQATRVASLHSTACILWNTPTIAP